MLCTNLICAAGPRLILSYFDWATVMIDLAILVVPVLRFEVLHFVFLFFDKINYLSILAFTFFLFAKLLTAECPCMCEQEPR